MELLDRRALFAVGRRAVMSAEAPRINPKVVDVDGSDLNILVNCGALIGEELSRSFGRCMAGLFVATARGDRLDRKIMDATGGLLPRKDAAGATIPLAINRPTFGAGAGIVGAGTRVTTAAGIQFALDVDVPFGGADLYMEGNFTCTQTGPIGRVPDTTGFQFVDQPFDTTMVVSAAGSGAGGVDQEDDIRYAGRYFGFFEAIRRGILPAIRQAALEVAGVEIATAAEILNPVPYLTPAAAIQLVVGDSDGASSPTMLQRVRDNLLRFRAGGIPVFVQGGSVINELVEWSVAYLPNFNTVQVRNQLRAVTVAVAQFLEPNETLYRSSLIAAARAVPGLVVNEDSLVAPAGDVIPSVAYGYDYAILRIQAQDVTIG
jgi:hypothetical protein